MHTGFWWGNLKERGRLEDIHVYVRIILKWIISMMGVYGPDSSDSGLGQLTGCCACGDELAGCIKCEHFLG